MNRFFIQAGAVLRALAVALGAFGAHALKDYLAQINRADTFETAVKYQFYHAIALIMVGVLSKEFSSNTLQWSGRLLFAGVLIFAGALYTICFTGITAFGAVAPIGGSLLIIGWLLLFWGVSKSKV